MTIDSIGTPIRAPIGAPIGVTIGVPIGVPSLITPPIEHTPMTVAYRMLLSGKTTRARPEIGTETGLLARSQTQPETGSETRTEARTRAQTGIPAGKTTRTRPETGSGTGTGAGAMGTHLRCTPMEQAS